MPKFATGRFGGMTRGASLVTRPWSQSYGLVRLVLVFTCANALSCARGSLYYEATFFKHDPMGEEHRPGLVKMAQEVLSTRTIRIQKQDGHPLSLDSKSIPTLSLSLLSAIFIMKRSEFRGAEADLLIQRKGRSPNPVTVWVDGEGNLLLMEGRRKVRQSKMLVKNGFPVFKQEGGIWTEAQKKSVLQAFELLGSRERALVLDIPFVLAQHPTKSLGDKGALYIQENCMAKILVFQSLFEIDRWQFVGDATAPLKSSVRTILHELGHALEKGGSRRLFCAYEKRLQDFQVKVRRYNESIGKRSLLGASAGKESLKAQYDHLEQERVRIEEMGRLAVELLQKNPVLDAYALSLDGHSGPTHYAKTSLSESFAESFSLFRTDREALQRILPDAVKWFQKGGHLLR